MFEIKEPTIATQYDGCDMSEDERAFWEGQVDHKGILPNSHPGILPMSGVALPIDRMELVTVITPVDSHVVAACLLDVTGVLSTECKRKLVEALDVVCAPDQATGEEAEERYDLALDYLTDVASEQGILEGGVGEDETFEVKPHRLSQSSRKPTVTIRWRGVDHETAVRIQHNPDAPVNSLSRVSFEVWCVDYTKIPVGLSCVE